MTAMPAERLTDPTQLYSAPPMGEELMMDIATNLAPKEWAAFTKDVIDAMRQSQEEGNFRPLNETVEAWVRTFLFMGRPEFYARWEEMQVTTEKPLTLDELKARRRLRKRPA